MIKTFIQIFVILFITTSCANIVAPTGGPKDNEAPKIAIQYPKNGSTNYKENFIIIKFDENIKEENLIYNTSISPFIDLKFKYKINKNILKLSWDKKLEENTTYTIQINKAIKDVTEGNSVNNISVSFSTGKDIDTNQINISNIKNKQTKIFVYTNQNISFDSLIKTQPKYSGYVNEDQKLNIKYIKEDVYQYILFDDNNNNNKVDLNEKLNYQKDVKIADVLDLNITSKNHTLDSSKILQIKDENYYTKIIFSKGIQKITCDNNDIKIDAINNKEYNIFAKNNINDIQIKYIDSTGNVIEKEVHINQKWINKKDTISTLKTNKRIIKPSLDSIFIHSIYPIENLDIDVKSNTETKIEKVNAFVYKVIFNNQKTGDTIQLSTKFIHNILYNIDIKELNTYFIVDKVENYGNLKATIETNYINYSIFIYNQQWSKEFKNIKEINLKNLEPGTYQIKAFIDSNQNGYYDAYNPIENRAEEPLILLDPSVLIKANWDIEDIKYIF